MPGSDHLGSKMAIFTHANVTVSGGPVSFWKITGSYYNHLYYFSGLAAYSPNAAFRFAKNSGSIDWGGVTNATLLMAGGVAEMVDGGAIEFFSAGTFTPLTVPLMIVGATRMVANTQRLRMYLKGNNRLADAYPTNIGGVVGKTFDLIDGVPMDQIGMGQALYSLGNDLTSFAATGGTAYALQNLVMYPSYGNAGHYAITWASYVYGIGSDVKIINP